MTTVGKALDQVIRDLPVVSKSGKIINIKEMQPCETHFEFKQKRTRLGKKLAEGGHGEVYEGCNETKTVCNEVAKVVYISSSDTRRTFQMEYFLTYLAGSKDLAPMLYSVHSCRSGKRFAGWMIQERWDGPVDRLVSNPKLVERAGGLPSIWDKIIKVVSEMHKIGIWHQDLFVKNMLYRFKRDGQLQVCVTDFGLAVPFHFQMKQSRGRPSIHPDMPVFAAYDLSTLLFGRSQGDPEQWFDAMLETDNAEHRKTVEGLIHKHYHEKVPMKYINVAAHQRVKNYPPEVFSRLMSAKWTGKTSRLEDPRPYIKKDVLTNSSQLYGTVYGRLPELVMRYFTETDDEGRSVIDSHFPWANVVTEDKHSLTLTLNIQAHLFKQNGVVDEKFFNLVKRYNLDVFPTAEPKTPSPQKTPSPASCRSSQIN